MRIVLLAMLSVACGGASPAPCTACAQVAGTYNQSADPTEIDCGDGMRLAFTGLSGPTAVTQAGSKVSGFWTGLSGVLHGDGSAELGPIPAMAESQDGSSAPIPGKLRLFGFFFGSPMRFDGTYTFTADSNGCELDAVTHLTR